MYDNDLELYNEFLEIYFDEYKALSDAKIRELDNKHEDANLFLERYNYYLWFEKEKSIDTTKGDEEESADLSSVPLSEVDEEEVIEGIGLKTLTPNKLLTRLPALLTQIKVGNNSRKLKNEIGKIVYSLYHHNKIVKKL